MGGSWQKSLDKKSSKYAPSLLALRETDFVICNDHGFPINPEIVVATVAAEAGHAQPSTTLAIYTQVYDKRRKEIRNQMSKELYE